MSKTVEEPKASVSLPGSSDSNRPDNHVAGGALRRPLIQWLPSFSFMARNATNKGNSDNSSSNTASTTVSEGEDNDQSSDHHARMRVCRESLRNISSNYAIAGLSDWWWNAIYSSGHGDSISCGSGSSVYAENRPAWYPYCLVS